MSYIHCHSCEWGQDDFWSIDGYHPFRADTFKWWTDILKEGMSGEKKFLTFGSEFMADHPEVTYTETEDGCLVDFRDFLALELRKKSRSIENMRWITYKDFQDDPDKTCPMCGSAELDID